MFDPKKGGWVPEQIKFKNKKESLKQAIFRMENQLLRQQAQNDNIGATITRNILKRFKDDLKKIENG